MCIWVSESMCVRHVCRWPQSLEEHMSASVTEVIVCLRETNPHPLHKQPMLLTTDPSISLAPKLIDSNLRKELGILRNVMSPDHLLQVNFLNCGS